jgi:hypothetical protein
VAETFGKTAGQHGYPASVLTDNAMVYTTRFAGGRGGRNQLETTLAGLGITQNDAAAVYHLLPKASPHGLGAGTHHRVRHDRIDKTGAISLRRAGRMHHIGIGRAHAGRTVLVLIDDLDIRVIDTTTGELLRHLTLDPTRDYQPRPK